MQAEMNRDIIAAPCLSALRGGCAQAAVGTARMALLGRGVRATAAGGPVSACRPLLRRPRLRPVRLPIAREHAILTLSRAGRRAALA